jgi:hypothetical protein
VPLTLIVLVSLPLYFGLSLAVVPILRQRLDEKFARGAENQAMLVETIRRHRDRQGQRAGAALGSAGTTSSPPMSAPASRPEPRHLGA